MPNLIKKGIAILGALVVAFLAWQLIFNDGGILKTGYNATVNGINTQWEKLAGSGNEILPTWDDAGADTGGKAFEIDPD